MLSMCFQANTNVLVAHVQLSNQGPSKREFRRSDWIIAKVDPHPVDLAVLHFQRVIVCSIVALSHRGQEI
jgi:hypothetical protein